MNRRSLIQALGLAPLVALISGKAEALPEVDNSLPVSARKQWERDKALWEERKLFTLSSPVPKLDAEMMRTVWNPGQEETMPFFVKLAKIISNSTKTPDIMTPATLKLLDKSGEPWGPTKEQFEARFSHKINYADGDIDVSELFRNGAFRLRQRVLMQARNIIEVAMPIEEETIRGERGLFMAHNYRLHAKMGDPDVLGPVLDTLGSLELSFFYYGAPPYPPTGRIHTFCDGTGTWAEFRPAA